MNPFVPRLYIDLDYFSLLTSGCYIHLVGNGPMSLVGFMIWLDCLLWLYQELTGQCFGVVTILKFLTIGIRVRVQVGILHAMVSDAKRGIIGSGLISIARFKT